jgi:hypothetical protein
MGGITRMAGDMRVAVEARYTASSLSCKIALRLRHNLKFGVPCEINNLECYIRCYCTIGNSSKLGLSIETRLMD